MLPSLFSAVLEHDKSHWVKRESDVPLTGATKAPKSHPFLKGRETQS